MVGPIEIDIPARGGAPGSGKTPTPGGDIFGQILREILAGGSGQAPRGQPAALVGGAGAAVFGDRLEVGRNVDQSQLDSLQNVFESFSGARHQ